MALSSSNQQGDRRPRDGYQLLYDAPRNQEAMMKTMVRTTSHRTAGELPSCLQCRHDRHSSTTSHHAATWPQDHDDNHAHTCSPRRRSLQAKLDWPSLRLTILRSEEPTALYKPWLRTLYKGSQGTRLGDPSLIHSFLHRRRAPEASLRAACLLALDLLPLPPFLHPDCKNF